jgi:hypothetical protein
VQSSPPLPNITSKLLPFTAIALVLPVLLYTFFNTKPSQFNTTTFAAEPTPTPAPSTSRITKKVMVLNFDPVIESHSNKRLHDVLKEQLYTGYKPVTFDNYARNLAEKYNADLRYASNFNIDYNVVDYRDLDIFPVKASGQTYTDDTYLACFTQTGTCLTPDDVNYNKILTDYQVCEKRNSGEIDELWIFGSGWFGYWESNLAGPGAFWASGRPVTNTTCQKLLPIMGFNYHTDVHNMLHSYSHRLEDNLSKTFGGMEYGYDSNCTIPNYGVCKPDPARPDTPWDKFTSRAYYSGYGYSTAGCGQVHFPHNSTKAPDYAVYDYASYSTYPTNCLDWENYPNLSGSTWTNNCGLWNCSSDTKQTQWNYFKYWLSHIPHSGGTDSSGKKANWWLYPTDYESAQSCSLPTTITAPTTPSPNSYSSVDCDYTYGLKLNWRISSGATKYHLTFDNLNTSGPADCVGKSNGEVCYFNTVPYDIPEPPNTKEFQVPKLTNSTNYKISIEPANSCGFAPAESVYWMTPTKCSEFGPLTLVRFYPRDGYGSSIIGAKIQGSNSSTTFGFVDLATITSAPDKAWTTVTVNNNQPYRFLRIIAPDSTKKLNFAELEFFASNYKLTGPAFDSYLSFFAYKAFDYNINTYFDDTLSTGVKYLGIDTGNNPAPTSTPIPPATPTPKPIATPLPTPIPTSIPPTPTSPSTSNLLTNPGFETGSGSSITGLFSYPTNITGLTFSSATDQKRSGSKSAKIAYSGSDATLLSRWMTNNSSITTTPGKSYSAEAYTKTNGAITGSAQLYIIFLENGTLNYKGGKGSSTTSNTNSAWTKLSVSSITAPANTFVRLEFRLTGNGTVWWDDAILN